MYTVHELISANYSTNEADYMFQMIEILKEKTEALRRGDFPDFESVYTNDADKGIRLVTNIDEALPPFDEVADPLYPHWEEFAAALEHFKPVFDRLPNDCKSFISFTNVQLIRHNTQRINEALRSTPFTRFHFQQNCQLHGGMSTLAALMENNTHLQQLELHRIQDMDRNDIAELSSVIHRHPSLVDIEFDECFSDGLGDDMLRLLLRAGGDLKLERLSMPRNHLRGFNVWTLLADFLATNPRLTCLQFDENYLDDNDVALIANALRSNTTLKYLGIGRNNGTNDGVEQFFTVLYDKNSLNSTADSNHSCSIDADSIMIENGVSLWNSDSREVNRAQKIYSLLSIRNKTMSNAQHFGDMDINLLPRLLEVVQKYSRLMEEEEEDEEYVQVKALSIVYEIMRRWDKVSPLYKSLGDHVHKIG